MELAFQRLLPNILMISVRKKEVCTCNLVPFSVVILGNSTAYAADLSSYKGFVTTLSWLDSLLVEDTKRKVRRQSTNSHCYVSGRKLAINLDPYQIQFSVDYLKDCMQTLETDNSISSSNRSLNSQHSIDSCARGFKRHYYHVVDPRKELTEVKKKLTAAVDVSEWYFYFRKRISLS